MAKMALLKKQFDYTPGGTFHYLSRQMDANNNEQAGSGIYCSSFSLSLLSGPEEGAVNKQVATMKRSRSWVLLPMGPVKRCGTSADAVTKHHSRGYLVGKACSCLLFVSE